MKPLFCLLGLASLASVACSEPFDPYDPRAHVSSTALPGPASGRIWLRRDGETKLWWADDLRREKLVGYASTAELMEKAEAAGVKFIEVTAGSVIGRNERGDVVLSLAGDPQPYPCGTPGH